MSGNFAAKPGLCSVIGQTFSKVWGRTSISGLSHAYEPPLRPWRAIWVVFFVVGLVCTVIDVTRVIQDYLEYPHTTQMDVVYDRSAYFPAVTVCNENRIDCENLMNASVHDPDNIKLVKLLHLSNCLEGNGLECLYQWQISAGVATREWISTVKPYCLHCKFCSRLAPYIRSQDEKYAADLTSLTFAMGCDSTCITSASSKGGTSSGGSQKNSIDSSSSDQEKSNSGTASDNSGNEEGKNAGGTTSDDSNTGEEKGTGESAGDSSGNGEEKGTGGDVDASSGGDGKGTGATADAESVDGEGKSTGGTVNDNSGTDEEKGTGESADDTSGGGEEKGTGETVNANPGTGEDKGTSENADDTSDGGEGKSTGETVNNNSSTGESEDDSSDNGEGKATGGGADEDSGNGEDTASGGSVEPTTKSDGVTANALNGDAEDIDGKGSSPFTTQSPKVRDAEVSSAASPEESSGKNAPGPAPAEEPSRGKAPVRSEKLKLSYGESVDELTAKAKYIELHGDSAGEDVRRALSRNRPKRATKSFNGRKRRKKFNPDDFEDSRTFNERMDLLMNFMKLETDLRLQIGVSFDDLIKDCSYLGKRCRYEQLFWKVSSPEYGTCYTFNTNITEFEDPLAGQRTTGLTGEQYSLNFMLNLKHHAFPPTLTPSKGARILVHPPNQVPDMGDNAMSLYPGASTSLAIEQLTIRRLPSPYKAGCINTWNEAEFLPEPVDVEAEGEEIKETYTVSRCKKMCIQDMFVQHCNCFHPLYPETDTYKRREGARATERKKPCLMSLKARDTSCTARVLTKFDQGILTCQCPPACSERAYNVYQSMNKWPRQTFMEELLAQMNISVNHLTEDDTKRMQSNIVQAKVFFKTLNTQELVQTPQFSTQTLFSSLGGALSLYLGISIVMIAEIVEFLFLLFWNIGLYATGRYRPTVAPEPVEMGDISQVIIRRPDGSQVSFLGSLSGYPLLAKPSYNPPAIVAG